MALSTLPRGIPATTTGLFPNTWGQTGPRTFNIKNIVPLQRNVPNSTAEGTAAVESTVEFDQQLELLAKQFNSGPFDLQSKFLGDVRAWATFFTNKAIQLALPPIFTAAIVRAGWIPRDLAPIATVDFDTPGTIVVERAIYEGYMLDASTLFSTGRINPQRTLRQEFNMTESQGAIMNDPRALLTKEGLNNLSGQWTNQMLLLENTITFGAMMELMRAANTNVTNKEYEMFKNVRTDDQFISVALKAAQNMFNIFKAANNGALQSVNRMQEEFMAANDGQAANTLIVPKAIMDRLKVSDDILAKNIVGTELLEIDRFSKAVQHGDVLVRPMPTLRARRGLGYPVDPMDGTTPLERIVQFGQYNRFDDAYLLRAGPKAYHSRLLAMKLYDADVDEVITVSLGPLYKKIGLYECDSKDWTDYSSIYDTEAGKLVWGNQKVFDYYQHNGRLNEVIETIRLNALEAVIQNMDDLASPDIQPNNNNNGGGNRGSGSGISSTGVGSVLGLSNMGLAQTRIRRRRPAETSLYTGRDSGSGGDRSTLRQRVPTISGSGISGGQSSGTGRLVSRNSAVYRLPQQQANQADVRRMQRQQAATDIKRNNTENDSKLLVQLEPIGNAPLSAGFQTILNNKSSNELQHVLTLLLYQRRTLPLFAPEIRFWANLPQTINSINTIDSLVAQYKNDVLREIAIEEIQGQARIAYSFAPGYAIGEYSLRNNEIPLPSYTTTLGSWQYVPFSLPRIMMLLALSGASITTPNDGEATVGELRNEGIWRDRVNGDQFKEAITNTDNAINHLADLIISLSIMFIKEKGKFELSIDDAKNQSFSVSGDDKTYYSQNLIKMINAAISSLRSSSSSSSSSSNIDTGSGERKGDSLEPELQTGPSPSLPTPPIPPLNNNAFIAESITTESESAIRNKIIGFLKEIPMSGRWVEFCINNNVWIPFGLLLARPYERWTTQGWILTISDPSRSNPVMISVCRRPEIANGYSTDDQKVTASMKFQHATVVLREEAIRAEHHVHATAYHGGGGTRVWDANNENDVRDFNSGTASSNRNSILVLPLDHNEDQLQQVIDIRGSFGLPVNTERKMGDGVRTHYKHSKILPLIWNGFNKFTATHVSCMNNERSINELKLYGNTVLFKGFQQDLNEKGDVCYMTAGNGPWGKNHYQGVREARLGRTQQELRGFGLHPGEYNVVTRS